MKEEIFISIMAILLIFNTFYILINPEATNTFLEGTIVSIVVTITGIAIISGISISVLGSSVELNDASIRIIFVVLILMNVLFQVNLYGFTMGMGLATNLSTVFNPTHDFFGLGTIIAGLFSFMALFSGVLMVAEDS